MLKKNGSTVYKLAENGVVERIEHNVQLSLSAGHMYNHDTVVDGHITRQRVISARGFEYMGSIAGITFRKPDRVVDENGIEVDNPIIRRRGSVVEWVRIREVLLGRSSNGNLRAIDLTLSYDVAAALSNALFGAWVDGGFPAWGAVVSDESVAEEMKKSPRRGKVHIGGGNCLLYNLTDHSVLRIIREHTSWSMMADRAASTIVERNLMRRYFGFHEADENGMVQFYSWPTADINWDDIKLEDQVVVEGQVVEAEVAAEVSSEVEQPTDVDAAPKDVSLAPAIRQLVRKLGKPRAEELATPILKHHRMRWGDIGSSQNYDALLAIYTELCNNA